MGMSQKCLYALRAVFDLARRYGSGPAPVGEIAKAQAIPPRFLELILGQLRQGGFVESRRGVHGGYLLALDPQSLTVGDIIRFVEGPVAPVRCIAAGVETDCPLYGHCAFIDMWSRACDAATEVYDTTTFQNLIDKEQASSDRYVGGYSI